MLWNNLVSRMVDGGALQPGDDNGGGGPGDGAITLFTHRHFSMHVGQIDRGTDNAVRQSVVLPHALTVDLTQVNSAFNSSGSVPVSAYALNAEAEPDFDLSDAQSSLPGLYSLAVPNVGHYLVRRQFDPDTAAGSNVGGTVIRNRAGHIIHNLGRKGGPSISTQVLNALQTSNENQAGHWDSRPFVLQNGPFAGKLVSPVITSQDEPGRSNQHINIVEPDASFGHVFGDDHRLAAIYGSWLANTDTPRLSSGCVVEHATDGSLIVLVPNNAYDGFKLHKIVPQPLNPALPDTNPAATINVPFTFFTSIYNARFRFRMIRLGNGNYFITWQNGQDQYGVTGTSINPITVYYCIVAADLSSVVVAPTPVDVDGSGVFAQWNADICLNAAGNVVVAWMTILNPEEWQYATNLSLVAKTFSPAGAQLVGKTEVLDYFDLLEMTSLNYPVTQSSGMVGMELVGSTVMVVSNLYRYGSSSYNDFGVCVCSFDGATLDFIAAQYVEEAGLINPCRYYTNSAVMAAHFISVTAVDGALYIGGASEVQASGGAKYRFVAFSLNPDCELIASTVIAGLPPTGLVSETSLVICPFWLTMTGDIMRADVLTSRTDNGDQYQITDFLIPDSLEQVKDYGAVEDNDLFVFLPGEYFIDARQEWNNVTFQLVNISNAQSLEAELFYSAKQTGLVGAGHIPQVNKHRFFVEFDSDSFIVGSGYYSADGSGPAPTGTLCRLAIDLVRHVDGVPVTVRNVGYIDLNTDGSYTKPEFITRLDLLDNDVIQLRQVNFVGNLLNEFRVAEATATLVGTGEIELWT